MDENNKKEQWDDEISGRKRLFVLNYCTSELFFMNGRRSYIEAYTQIKDGKPVYRPTNETADVNASRLLSNAKVRKAVRLLLKESQPEADRENGYRLLHDLVIQATYNPADIIDKKGRLKVKDLTELGDLAKCIDSISTGPQGTFVKLASRKFAQDKLLKYYDLVKEVPEIKADLPVIILPDKTASVDAWNEKARK